MEERRLWPQCRRKETQGLNELLSKVNNSSKVKQPSKKIFTNAFGTTFTMEKQYSVGGCSNLRGTYFEDLLYEAWVAADFLTPIRDLFFVYQLKEHYNSYCTNPCIVYIQCVNLCNHCRYMYILQVLYSDVFTSKSCESPCKEHY